MIYGSCKRPQTFGIKALMWWFPPKNSSFMTSNIIYFYQPISVIFFNNHHPSHLYTPLMNHVVHKSDFLWSLTYILRPMFPIIHLICKPLQHYIKSVCVPIHLSQLINLGSYFFMTFLESVTNIIMPVLVSFMNYPFSLRGTLQQHITIGCTIRG